MKLALKWSLIMVLAVIGMGSFTSCSDDDDNTPVVPTVAEVTGDYKGKMTFTLETLDEVNPLEETPEATELELAVKNDTIIFNKFPVDALITAIVGEEAAPGIIASVGNVTYKVGYKPTMNAANDSISMELKPEVLTIEIKGEGEDATALSVAVTVTAPEKGSYAIDKKNLKFNLVVTEAKLGDFNAIKGKNISLSFDMAKK